MATTEGTPFAVRTFVRRGTHNSPEEYRSKSAVGRVLILYLWNSSTVAELAAQLAEAMNDVDLELEFKVNVVRIRGGNVQMIEYGSFTIHDIPELGSMPVFDSDGAFRPGDFLDVQIRTHNPKLH